MNEHIHANELDNLMKWVNSLKVTFSEHFPKTLRDNKSEITYKPGFFDKFLYIIKGSWENKQHEVH